MIFVAWRFCKFFYLERGIVWGFILFLLFDKNQKVKNTTGFRKFLQNRMILFYNGSV